MEIDKTEFHNKMFFSQGKIINLSFPQKTWKEGVLQKFSILELYYQLEVFRNEKLELIKIPNPYAMFLDKNEVVITLDYTTKEFIKKSPITDISEKILRMKIKNESRSSKFFEKQLLLSFS